VSTHEILATSLDGKVRQYDLRAGKLRVDDVGPSVMCGTYSNDYNCVLTSTLDSCVRLFDKMEGELLNEFRGHVNNQYRTQSCFSFDDSTVFSGSEDHHIYVWDLLEAQLKATLKAHTHVVACLVHSPSEQLLCSGSIDKTVIIWKQGLEFERR
jgi:mitogen-activated protein kinase organizer 1